MGVRETRDVIQIRRRGQAPFWNGDKSERSVIHLDPRCAFQAEAMLTLQQLEV